MRSEWWVIRVEWPERTLQTLTGAFGFFKMDPLLRMTSPGTITNSWSDSTTTDGWEYMDATSGDGSSETSEVCSSSSEGFPMYVTGGGVSEEITVTSTSDEFCSWSWASLGRAALTNELCSKWSGRSGWTTAIGCVVFLVSGVAKQKKQLIKRCFLFHKSQMGIGTRLALQVNLLANGDTPGDWWSSVSCFEFVRLGTERLDMRDISVDSSFWTVGLLSGSTQHWSINSYLKNNLQYLHYWKVDTSIKHLFSVMFWASDPLLFASWRFVTAAQSVKWRLYASVTVFSTQ